MIADEKLKISGLKGTKEAYYAQELYCVWVEYRFVRSIYMLRGEEDMLRDEEDIDTEGCVSSLVGVFKHFGKVFSTISKTYSSSETQIGNPSATKRTEEDIAHAYETISMVFDFLVAFHKANWVIIPLNVQ